MRIAVVTPLFPIRQEPFRGQPIYLTVRELAKLADVHVFCPQAHYPNIPFLRPQSYVYYPLDASFQPTDVPTTYLEYNALPVISRPLNGWACYRALRPHLREFQPDIILSYWLYPEGHAAMLAAADLKVPVIVGARGSDLSVNLDAVVRRKTQETLQRVDGAVMVSEELRQRAISFGAKPQTVRTILNGCDTTIFYPQDRENTRLELSIAAGSKVIVFVGHLNAAKGVRELFHAVSQIRSDYPDLKLVMVGDGGIEQQLPDLAASLGISSLVHFAGKAKSTEISKWLAAADVFTLPSYAEGCPNVVIEALACGRPVVATTVGAIPDLVNEQTGILVPPRDAQALADALRKSLEASWNSEAIALQWQRGWDQVAKDTLDLITTVKNNDRKPQN